MAQQNLSKQNFSSKKVISTLIFIFAGNIFFQYCNKNVEKPKHILAKSFYSLSKINNQLVSIVGEDGSIFTLNHLDYSLQKSTTQLQEWLFDVAFYNTNIGWAVGRSGNVLQTKNGGRDWFIKNLGMNNNLHAVWVRDKANVWAAGSDGVIVHTSNSGKNWRIARLGYDGVIRDLFFHDKTGWAVGDYGMILVSKNNGVTWRKLKNITVPTIANLHGITFIDSAKGLAWGDNGTLLETTDGGKKWLKQNLKTSFSIRDMVFTSDVWSLAMGTNGLLSLIEFEDSVQGAIQSWGIRRVTDCTISAHALERDTPNVKSSPEGHVTDTSLVQISIKNDSIKTGVTFTDVKDENIPSADSSFVTNIDTNKYAQKTDLVKSQPDVESFYKGTLLADGSILAVGSRGFIAQISLNLETIRDDSSDNLTQIVKIDTISMSNLREARATGFVNEFKSFLGAPYYDNPLGEGFSGKVDTDPRLNINGFDCVTAIEQALAFEIASQGENQALSVLDHIRYAAGKISFLTRNHFFVPDWIPQNSWLVEDVTSSIGDSLAEQLNRTIGRSSFFSFYNISIPHIRDQIYSTYIIPIDKVKLLFNRLENGMIVVFIGKNSWLFATHTGILVKNAKENSIVLRHASSAKNKVVDEDFLEYLTIRESQLTGIKLLTIVE